MLFVVALIAFAVIIQVANNLLRMEAKKAGADTEKNNFSIFPRLNEMFGASKPDFVGDDSVTILKKGFDIKLEGAAQKHINSNVLISTYAVQPPNFRGIAPIP